MHVLFQCDDLAKLLSCHCEKAVTYLSTRFPRPSWNPKPSRQALQVKDGGTRKDKYNCILVLAASKVKLAEHNFEWTTWKTRKFQPLITHRHTDNVQNSIGNLVKYIRLLLLVLVHHLFQAFPVKQPNSTLLKRTTTGTKFLNTVSDTVEQNNHTVMYLLES